MAILGEGNVSARIDDERFLVKASGTRMDRLKPKQLVEVRFKPLLAAMSSKLKESGTDIDQLLMDARVDNTALKPSVESIFHAWLLRLPDVRYVAHCHPIAVNQILCSTFSESFARERLIPDHVVYCGTESVLIPYVDPGLVLAREIAEQVESYVDRTGARPKTILLQNHGAIALGSRLGETAAAINMLEKAAKIFVGAASLGGPLFMDKGQVQRISGRPDEQYRIRMMRNDR
jgi:ribulose-5-phosphate 4-epimerase/fuculose-1-phosphate aldolase